MRKLPTTTFHTKASQTNSTTVVTMIKSNYNLILIHVVIVVILVSHHHSSASAYVPCYNSQSNLGFVHTSPSFCQQIFNNNNNRNNKKKQPIRSQKALPVSLSTDSNNNSKDGKIIPKEAEQLLAKAKQIRDSLEEQTPTPSTSLSGGNVASNTRNNRISPFNVQLDARISESCASVGYRLYIDLGREDGTWMDPRWGASGKRIEFTIDVSFLSPKCKSNDNDDNNNDDDGGGASLATQDIVNNMVKDNLSGKSSAVRMIQSATTARLRNGFDRVNFYNGGYRIDMNMDGETGGKGKRLSSSNTLRFYLNSDGTEGKSTYGDVSIPKGNLYFSLPCFGSDAKQLSTKEGIVTVRQIGWHTGWRREESRIVGVFRAVPIDQAKKRDGF